MELLEWDAATYDSLPLPHVRWGSGVIDRLAPQAGEVIVDLGCGTGRDTEAVLDRAPGSRVVAIDGSKQMLAQFGQRLAGRLDRVTAVEADLRQPIELDVTADGVMSVAALHWLADPSPAFANAHRFLRPGGRLVVECGGRGNIARVDRAIAAVRGNPSDEGTFGFAGVGETEDRLAAAGFTDVAVRLLDDPVPLEPGGQLEAYLATVVLGAILRDLAEADRLPFVRAVAAELGEPVIDYVRLQMEARRPA